MRPDHEYPSHLELRLTATDSGGLTHTVSVQLNPMTVVLNFASVPSGLQLAVNGVSTATPFSRTVIVGSTSSVSATSPQLLGGTTYVPELVGWWSAGTQHRRARKHRDAHRDLPPSATPPSNTGLPSISGPPKGLQLATAGRGQVRAAMTFEYEWQRCASNGSSCTAISGATANMYTPTSADVGSRLRCTVIATNTVGSNSATSIRTGVVKRARLPGLAGASVR